MSIACLAIAFIGRTQVSRIHLKVSVPACAKDQVFIAGSFNNWKAGDTLYRLKRLHDNTHTIELPVFQGKSYEYKYNLGSWAHVEVDLDGKDIDNRRFVTSRRSARITDSVRRFKQPAPVEVSGRNNQVIDTKDSILRVLQPKLGEMVDLLKTYVFNLLNDTPSVKTDSTITAQLVASFSESYQKVNRACWQLTGALTVEQKRKIAARLKSLGPNDNFINILIAAIGEAFSTGSTAIGKE